MDAARPNLPRAILSGTVAINAVGSIGDTTLIASPGANFRLRIWKIVAVCTGAQTIQFKSGATALTGAMPFAANGGLADDAISGLGAPVFLCGENEAFILTETTTQTVNGYVAYDVAPAAGY